MSDPTPLTVEPVDNLTAIAFELAESPPPPRVDPPFADPSDRVLAALIDLAFGYGGLFVIWLDVSVGSVWLTMFGGLLVITALSLNFILEAIWGVTPGKWVLRLRIRRRDGGKPWFRQLLVRGVFGRIYLFVVLAMLFNINHWLDGDWAAALIVIALSLSIINLMVGLASETGQALSDKIARTHVLRGRRRWRPFDDANSVGFEVQPVQSA